MRVLITRPREDAEAVAEALAARGVETMIEPLLEITDRPAGGLDLARVQAVLLTSANGARALARATGRRDLSVLAVGEATAAAAEDAGFRDVEAAGGDVAALAELAAAGLEPGAGPVVHVSGSVVAGDLAGRLGALGFTVHRAVLYDTRPVEALSEVAATALSQGAIDAVLLFSPRTAKAFVRLAERAGVAAALGRVRALCLSANVAGEARAIRWRAVCVAERPESAALYALIEATVRQGRG